MVVAPGYGKAGNTSPDANRSDVIGALTLRSTGYNLLTWDPRGMGGSGGNVCFNSPDFEARDVQALIDFVATQPDALLDGPGDPRVGMSGTSYGGAIQLVSAALDPRIDAIVPDQAWHSLVTSLFKDGALKAGCSMRSAPAARRPRCSAGSSPPTGCSWARRLRSSSAHASRASCRARCRTRAGSGSPTADPARS